VADLAERGGAKGEATPICGQYARVVTAHRNLPFLSEKMAEQHDLEGEMCLAREGGGVGGPTVQKDAYAKRVPETKSSFPPLHTHKPTHTQRDRTFLIGSPWRSSTLRMEKLALPHTMRPVWPNELQVGCVGTPQSRGLWWTR
jgi:hypothetical protein